MRDIFDLKISDNLDTNGNISTLLEDNGIFCLADLSHLTYFNFLTWEQDKYESLTWYFAIKDMVLWTNYFKRSIYEFSKEEFESMNSYELIKIFDELTKNLTDPHCIPITRQHSALLETMHTTPPPHLTKTKLPVTPPSPQYCHIPSSIPVPYLITAYLRIPSQLSHSNATTSSHLAITTTPNIVAHTKMIHRNILLCCTIHMKMTILLMTCPRIHFHSMPTHPTATFQIITTPAIDILIPITSQPKQSSDATQNSSDGLIWTIPSRILDLTR